MVTHFFLVLFYLARRLSPFKSKRRVFPSSRNQLCIVLDGFCYLLMLAAKALFFFCVTKNEVIFCMGRLEVPLISAFDRYLPWAATHFPRYM